MSSKKKLVVKTPSPKKQIVQKGTKSKMQVCEDWLSDNPKLKRKDILPVLMDIAKLSKPAASTYFQILRKRLNYK